MAENTEKKMSAEEPAAEESSLEEAFSRLDALLEKLSDRNLPLEEAFSLYEEGTKLLKSCNDKLDKVEKKMTVINEEGGFDEF